MSSSCRRMTAGSASSTAGGGQLLLLRRHHRTAEVWRLPSAPARRRWGLLIQAPLRRRPWAEPLESDGRDGQKTRRHSFCCRSRENPNAHFESRHLRHHPPSMEAGVKSADRKVEVVVAAAATVVLGVGNRVLYKAALVPLKHYPFFLAQLATFGYVLVYFSILCVRYHAGIVTDEMLSLPKTPFLVVGILEALSAASGMAAGAILSGASIPILSQSFLVWQLILSAIFLGRSYRVNQLVGCFLVAVGVIVTVASGSNAGHSLKGVSVYWSLLMILSFLFQAADTVLKEIIFLNCSKQLKEGSLDLFVVNSYGSAFQALFISLMLPFLSKLWGVPFNQLPYYLRSGAGCFMNTGTSSIGCDGAPLLPLLFVIVNMGFNISLLHLLKISSAVVSSLASTFSVPIAVYVFTLPLPYLGTPSSLPSGFMKGAIILVLGLLTYAWTPLQPPDSTAN